MDTIESRAERLEQVAQWLRSGRIDPESGNFSCLRLTDDEERFLTWLHAPNPTEPVLVEFDDKTIPAVKFSVDNGIFALYVMDGLGSPSLENEMVFAGLYDPKALTLYVDGAAGTLANLPFASTESLEEAFLDAATEAFEDMVSEMDVAPDMLEGMACDVWDVFRRAYPSVVHEAYVFGGEPEDVLEVYTGSLIRELSPAWNKDLAAAFLGDEEAVIARFLQEDVPEEAFVLGACACSSLMSYWEHIEEHERHPANRLRVLASACEHCKSEFVQMDLWRRDTGHMTTIIFPKCYFADGAYGAFDTRRWPDSVREVLMIQYPETYGCFHVTDIWAVRELFTGKPLYQVPQESALVYENAWQTLEEEKSLGGSVLPGF